MRRYRLTFDPNPKELASREAGGSHVVLLWSRRSGRAAVVVEEDATGDVVELDVQERENPLELHQHPFVYIPARGHPGWRPPSARPMSSPQREQMDVQPPPARGREFRGSPVDDASRTS